MSQNGSAFPPLSEDNKFNLVAGIVAAVTMVASVIAFWWIWWLVQPAAAAPIPASPIYANYDPAHKNLKPESLAAMQAYTEANEQPQNVKVLKGWTTAQISAYMVAQVSGGLKVDCSYCHNVANFADESNPKKATARAMMLMSGDLNRQYINKLPYILEGQKIGFEITCATCHNGQPVLTAGTYPRKIQNSLPNDFRLPLERDYPGGLVITGDKTKSLDDAEVNQNVMYHMNVSLGQGCTFCHNARYFPATGVEEGGRDQKQHAIWMLQMSKHLKENYGSIMANKDPSCWMCHQGAVIPPGAAKPGQIPDVLNRSSRPPTP
jgi:photosynthetic reaction center cytochrome c subunit